ncbi:MAG: LexA family transcriptional regulator [Acidobacteria bacterium]|jgi:DNA polymerase V|nr:LexA family transcriptional regulator [Acidobacteriota bacterium]
MKGNVSEIIVPDFSTKLLRPLISSRVSAGFGNVAEDYIESRIDLNRDLIPHPDFTFYARISGDSMEILFSDGDLLIADRECEVEDKDLIIAAVDGELYGKRFRILDDGSMWLYSENARYKPIPITAETHFKPWGKVIHSIQSFR